MNRETSSTAGTPPEPTAAPARAAVPTSAGQHYVPGILGGVGPLAHVQFEQVLLARNHGRGARSDQQHPVWILVSGTATPDRTRALLEGGETALPYLVHYAGILERAGAHAIFVICNTAHAYHAEVQRELSVPWVHMMQTVARAITTRFGRGTAAGILGTNGTLATRLYHRALEAHGLVPVAPALGSATQEGVVRAIYDSSIGIKASGAQVTAEARGLLADAARWCIRQGASVVVPACTEVSAGLTPEWFAEAPLVDPLEVMADTALDLAYGTCTPAELWTPGSPALT
jgi:aspartate racemase